MTPVPEAAAPETPGTEDPGASAEVGRNLGVPGASRAAPPPPWPGPSTSCSWPGSCSSPAPSTRSPPSESGRGREPARPCPAYCVLPGLPGPGRNGAGQGRPNPNLAGGLVGFASCWGSRPGPARTPEPQFPSAFSGWAAVAGSSSQAGDPQVGWEAGPRSPSCTQGGIRSFGGVSVSDRSHPKAGTRLSRSG